MTYSTLEGYRVALQTWEREALAFQAAETTRLAVLEERIKKCQSTGGILFFAVLVAIMIAVGWGLHASIAAMRTMALDTTIIRRGTNVVGPAILAGGLPNAVVVGLVELYLLKHLVNGCRRLERYRLRCELAPRIYCEPRPTYAPPASPPPPRHNPPPRQEQRSQPPPPPPPRREEPVREFSQITSLREAIEILGLPPRTSLSAAKAAYRGLVGQYHPDRVAHLGPELRELAARKTLQINLAFQFIKKHISNG